MRKNYQYDLTSPSGAAPDPLEHFLFESKRGHCEFYSTAMALMLRHLSVPSRNVTGFVGGTYNRFGDFYAVRQGDAHSWVEAYLPKRGWVRFDPTPPSSASPQARTQGAAALLREILEAASQSWEQNVEGFDMAKQVGILQAIRRAMSAVTPSSSRSGGLKDRLTGKRLALLVLGIFMVMAGGWFLWKRRQSFQAAPARRHAPQAAQALLLYQKLDRALEQVGAPRPIATPPLTHATSLAQAGHPVGSEAEALTRIYLSVRFGDSELSSEDAADFLLRVDQLRRLGLEAQAASSSSAA
jgi:hypothetical protein